MKILPQSTIKEIAGEIADGNTCYYHRYTGEITIIDYSIEDKDLIAAQEQIQTELEKKIESYVKIEKLSIASQLVIMKEFLEELPDRSVRKQLSNALNRKNPARNFNTAVEGDIGLNQHWQNYNFKAYQEWVSTVIIDVYNY